MMDILEEIKISNDVNIDLTGNTVRVEGSLGKLERKFSFPNLLIEKQEDKVILSSKNASKREKRMVNTFKAHINNMIKGASNGFEYKLKICSSHFPMNVSVDKNLVVIKNFLGEKVPRKSKILEGVNVKVEGTDIIVTGVDIEKVSQTAANIESACRVTKRDRRVFQDGCYIYERN